MGSRHYIRLASALAVAAMLAGCEVRVDERAAGLSGETQTTRATGATVQPAARETPAVAGVRAAPAAQATTAVAQPMALANGLNAVQVVQIARPSVVNIVAGAVVLDQFRRPQPVEAGTGTGVIFDQRGYILTNSHVVRAGQSQPADLIRVTLADDRSFPATVIDDDPLNDLAIIKIDAPNLTAARIGDSERLQAGEPVVAIGHALALPGGPTVSTGVVSALGRQIDEPNGVTLPNLVQTDAAINPGNSGGPLLNANAEVIGINTAGAAEAQGISFAVAINQAKSAMDSVRDTGRVVRPLLGVRILGALTPAIAEANNLPVRRGVVVEPDPNGPAGRAGMRDGDIIVAVDGQEIQSAPDLLAAIRRHKPGEQIRLRVVRQNGQAAEITATLIQATS